MNYGTWCEQHSAPDAPETALWSLLQIHPRAFGKIFIRGLVTDGAAWLIDDHLAALCDGIDPPHQREGAQLSWLEFALNPFPDLFGMPPGGVSVKAKDAQLKRRLSADQIDAAYEHLSQTDSGVLGGMLALAPYGGRINAVSVDATASAQREAILSLACNAGWLDPNEVQANLQWVRAIYGGLFAATGGVPVPGDAFDGALINHPDIDFADATLNTSGVPWHTLYYKGNYRRLQQVKAQWDPRNLFHHALSIQPA